MTKLKLINIILFVVLIVLVISDKARAASIEIAGGVNTTHLLSSTFRYEDAGNTSDKAFNENNKLLALSYKFDSGYGVMLAKFTNSYYNKTTALGLSYEYYNKDGLELSVIAGLTKGYTRYELGNLLCAIADDVCLFVAPVLGYTLVRGSGGSLKINSMLFSTAIVTTLSFSYEF
jgi:hypothetical protein